MIPLYHDFAGETVLVFGGGSVGARKARRFAAEANVVVVSPEFVDERSSSGRQTQSGDADEAFGDAERVREAPSPDEVAGWIDRTDPVLVVAATDDEAVNEAAERAARERGVLVNRADRSGGRDAGSVVVPATVDDGGVTAAISTGGASPALSKYLRERVAAELDGAGAMAELSGEIRETLKDANCSPEERRDAVRAVVRSSAVWKALRTGESKPRQEADRVIRNTMGGDR